MKTKHSADQQTFGIGLQTTRDKNTYYQMCLQNNGVWPSTSAKSYSFHSTHLFQLQLAASLQF